LRTTATRDEIGWVINGTKIYTTMGDLADYVWLAARTDPNAPVKHAGISVFLVPTKTPGITIRPDIALYGHPACTVFYDNVHVPENALVGQVNGAWKIITSALASERVLMGGIVAETRAISTGSPPISPRQNVQANRCARIHWCETGSEALQQISKRRACC
jgi:alkylation response protein AidB-like acyl-CoA dehydrogenase